MAHSSGPGGLSGSMACMVNLLVATLELIEYLRTMDIIHQTTVPYNPEQNGAAERVNRTLMERAQAMISDANLPPEV
ncbi:g8596 [Coccomyxa viridis]|uniref:G8596 protein n=1 Tax=Coccomyxa viridis TaxID=1274662 RepID=A0ABP1G1T9_9CHLO